MQDSARTRIDVTVLDPGGAGRDVAILARPGTPWAAVAARLGPARRWWCGGEPVPDDAAFGAAGPRSGATVSARQPLASPGEVTGQRLDVVGGPDAGTSVPLRRDPVTVGRAAGCGLPLRDPQVSRRHAEVRAGVRAATVRDVGSAGGTTVDGVAVSDSPTVLGAGQYLRVGDTFLRAGGAGVTAAVTRRTDGGALVVTPAVRRQPDATEPAELTWPARPQPSASAPVHWLGALLPAALGVGLALALHATQFLLFALLSPATLLGSAVADRLRGRRSGRRAARDHRRAVAAARQRVAAELARETRERRAAAVDPVTVERIAAAPGEQLWSRPPDGPGLLNVRIGLADLPSRVRVRDGARSEPAGVVRAVPLVLDLAAGGLALGGPQALMRPLAAWVVAQLAVQVAPGDLTIRLMLTPDAEPSWRWARWLPHLAAPPAVTADQRADLVGELVSELAARHSSRRGDRAGGAPRSGPWTVLVVDGYGALAGTPGLAQLVRDGPASGVALVAVDGSARALQACASVAEPAGDAGTALAVRSAHGSSTVIADHVASDWCERVARALAPLRAAGGAAALPSACRLLPLLGTTEPTPEAIRARWTDAAATPETVLGVGPSGPVVLDLVRDGPHALVAGTTGSGKSELLRTLVAGLAVQQPPDRLGFVLIDYKGGAAFADCAALPHALGTVTDLDVHSAARALASLQAELRRREQLFSAVGARDLREYRTRSSRPTAGRLVIVVDEFAELAAELPDFVTGLVGVARRGRSLGVHLVLATQRPAGVVSAEIRANTNIRIALRVTDAGDSVDVLDCADAAAIDRRRPGRAYLRVPGGRPVPVQTALVSGTPGDDGDRVEVFALDGWRRPVRPPARTPAADAALPALVGVLREAATAGGFRPQERPWLPPLPETIPVAALDAAADPAAVPLGLLDLPAAQRQMPLTIGLAAGESLLLVGGPRSGRTGGLLTLAATAASRLAPDRLHLHVADHAGGALAALARLPHCGSLSVADLATTVRLLERLAAEVDRRRALPDTADEPLQLLLLDGWEQFLAAAAEQDLPDAPEALLGLLRAGPSAGVTVAITGDRAALTARLCSAVETKLALRLTDRGDYALLGLADRAVPNRLPPGRAVRAADGAEVQLAHPGEGPSPGAARDAITAVAARWASPANPPTVRVRALPRSVPLDALLVAAAPARPDRASVVLGAGGDECDPLAVDLFAGRSRLLVAGPPGSGRSTLLLGLAQQLADGGPRLVVAGPERSPLVSAAAPGALVVTPSHVPGFGPAEGGAVLLVDDCEALRDTSADGALAAWLARRPAAGRTAVVAAGCGDELAVAFRGIAAEVRRARCAVLLDPGPGEGDLLGLRLRRRRPGTPPGRGLVVGDPAWGARFRAGPLPIQVGLP